MKIFSQEDLQQNPWKRGYMLGWSDTIRSGGVPKQLYDGTYEEWAEERTRVAHERFKDKDWHHCRLCPPKTDD